MNKSTFCGIIVLLISINYVMSQSLEISRNRNILECMEIIEFDIHKYVQADVVLESTEKIVDLESGYYEINIDLGREIKLCQVAKYNNLDGSILLGISGYYGDEQCNYHPFYFYEISKSGDSFIPLENKAILPSLDFSIFFRDSTPFYILEKYLPEIKKTYLESNATIEDLLNEIYDFHIVFPRKGTKTKVTLTLCDYIPLNEVNIGKDDWGIIEDYIRVIELIYDKDQKQFKTISSKDR
jgi:hypothetical protein